MTATISPTIHEAAIERHFVRGEDDAALSQLRDAVKVTREVAVKASHVTETVLQNTLKTEAQRHREARAANFDLLQHATKALDAATQTVKAEIATLKQKIKGPPVDPRERDLQSEMRTRLGALPEERRKAIIAEAVRNNDDTLIGAILHARPWMVGMSEPEHQMARHTWARQRYPRELHRLDRLERAVEDVMRIGPVAISFIDNLTDAKLVTEAERKEKAAHEALAAARKAG